ncbi:VPLPA-CTERM sorting domain-containing protein [Chromatocurvus halotolerans]|uniref:Putative secreted protein n=1 Tax=Chromatocurvus halotolerans TaxID=1132028 RepID=A0A4R2KRB7_9GAMM|nr:VPLPA-CTERM sorting domain-containing protein [Chromatocurvus halotolerans]TCO76303.1 putative secreted protein [Chromatocurvus halotolerans]
MKFQFRHFVIPTMFAAAAAFVSSASAGPMTLELEFSGPFAEPGSKNMTIHYDNGSGTSKQARVAAGMFSGRTIEGSGTTIDSNTLFINPGNVLAYCVDILQTLQQTRTVYTLENVGQNELAWDGNVSRNFGRMLSFLGAVNFVQQRDFASDFTPDSKNWLRPNTDWMSAAIQLGIWESLYEKTAIDDEAPVDLSVSTSDSQSQWFWATNFNLGTEGSKFLTDAFALVNTDSSSYSAVDASEVLWAVNTSGQDLIIDPVDVPLPATGFLLLGGIGALAWRRRCH